MIGDGHSVAVPTPQSEGVGVLRICFFNGNILGKNNLGSVIRHICAYNFSFGYEHHTVLIISLCQHSIEFKIASRHKQVIVVSLPLTAGNGVHPGLYIENHRGRRHYVAVIHQLLLINTAFDDERNLVLIPCPPCVQCDVVKFEITEINLLSAGSERPPVKMHMFFRNTELVFRFRK